LAYRTSGGDRTAAINYCVALKTNFPKCQKTCARNFDCVTECFDNLYSTSCFNDFRDLFDTCWVQCTRRTWPFIVQIGIPDWSN
jgi:hypothetical protein